MWWLFALVFEKYKWAYICGQVPTEITRSSSQSAFKQSEKLWKFRNMVERLLTGDVDTSNRECNVTNLMNEWDSFSENLPKSVEYDLLPTINENSEGFQSTTSDKATTLRTKFRTRRNSHPISFREGLTRTNLASTTNKLAGATRCKQGPTKCRKCNSRDPMLSFKLLPKQDNIIFNKHKLDKIDEGDSMTELNEENDADFGKETGRRCIVDISRYSKNMTGRRSSYPADSTALQQRNTLAQDIRDFKQCQEDIVTKWMKFF